MIGPANSNDGELNFPNNTANDTPKLSTPTPRVRLWFTRPLDVLLLKYSISLDAHIAGHGETRNKFLEAHQLFLASVPPSVFDPVIETNWKSLNNRYKNIHEDHRLPMQRNFSVNVIIEGRGEKEFLRDGLMQIIDGVEGVPSRGA